MPPERITKKEMMILTARRCGTERFVVNSVVENFLIVLKERVSAGEQVWLDGFGNFSLKKRSARKRNLKGLKGVSQEVVYLPETVTLKFKPTLKFRKQIKSKNP